MALPTHPPVAPERLRALGGGVPAARAAGVPVALAAGVTAVLAAGVPTGAHHVLY